MREFCKNAARASRPGPMNESNTGNVKRNAIYTGKKMDGRGGSRKRYSAIAYLAGVAAGQSKSSRACSSAENGPCVVQTGVRIDRRLRVTDADDMMAIV